MFSFYKFPDIPRTKDDCDNFWRYTLIWGLLQDYSGDKERRNRVQLCAHNAEHLNETDRVPGPYLERATPEVIDEQ